MRYFKTSCVFIVSCVIVFTTYSTNLNAASLKYIGKGGVVELENSDQGKVVDATAISPVYHIKLPKGEKVVTYISPGTCFEEKCILVIGIISQTGVYDIKLLVGRNHSGYIDVITTL